MAHTRCKNCGSELFPQVTTCSTCGNPFTSNSCGASNTIIVIGVAIIVIIGLIVLTCAGL